VIAELAAAVLGGAITAGTGWFLERRREAAKLHQTRSLLTRAILDDLNNSLAIYDKIAEEWERTKIVWFPTLNELKLSRQPYLNGKDWAAVLDDENLRRELFRYYMQSAEKIALLERGQTRKYELERIYNDVRRHILLTDPNATPEAAGSKAFLVMAGENDEHILLTSDILPSNVARLVAMKSTAQSLIGQLKLIHR
jgi:hypothetical protein